MRIIKTFIITLNYMRSQSEFSSGKSVRTPVSVIASEPIAELSQY